MTRKPNSRAWNDILQGLESPKKQVWANKRSRACWYVSLITSGSSTNRMCAKNRPWISKFAEWFSRDWKRVTCIRLNTKYNEIPHHDNVPCHTAISTNEFLENKKGPVSREPPYSPDLCPCDFLFFPRLKIHLKGHNLGNTKIFKRLLPTNSRLLQHCFNVVWLPKRIIFREATYSCDYILLNLHIQTFGHIGTLFYLWNFMWHPYKHYCANFIFKFVL